MGEIMKIKLIIPVLIMVILTSCTQVISDSADEIRLNSWRTELNSGSTVALRFDGDNAELKVDSKDKDACVSLKGLCVIDEKTVFIYNKSEGEPYYFNYNIKNNTLVLKYDSGTLVLTREN